MGARWQSWVSALLLALVACRSANEKPSADVYRAKHAATLLERGEQVHAYHLLVGCAFVRGEPDCLRLLIQAAFELNSFAEANRACTRLRSLGGVHAKFVESSPECLALRDPRSIELAPIDGDFFERQLRGKRFQARFVPSNGWVFLNNELVALESGTVDLSLHPGRHLLEICAAGFQDYMRVLYVAPDSPGTDARIDYVLKAEKPQACVTDDCTGCFEKRVTRLEPSIPQDLGSFDIFTSCPLKIPRDLNDPSTINELVPIELDDKTVARFVAGRAKRRRFASPPPPGGSDGKNAVGCIGYLDEFERQGACRALRLSQQSASSANTVECANQAALDLNAALDTSMSINGRPLAKSGPQRVEDLPARTELVVSCGSVNTTVRLEPGEIRRLDCED
ncbi:MAG: hypothetical protein AAF654_02485 [Myxococcota bacterium]